MSVTVEPRVRTQPAVQAPGVASTEPTLAPPPSGAGHWVRILGIPFVLGASFYALAIGLGDEWPMIPAVIFGPILLISALIYVMLTSDANTTD